MARKVCTKQPGQSVCCTAAQQGLTGRPFVFTVQSGCMAGQQRCGQCDIVTSSSRKHPGARVFRFRFHKNASCGIGPSGCPALAGGGAPAGGGGIQLPAPGQGGLSLPGF